MSTRTKRRLLTGLLALITVWPPLQFVFMEQVQGSPWKLYGLAMYCNLHEVDIGLVDSSGSEPRPILPSELSPQTQAALRRFNRYRSTLGTLVDPAPLAFRVLKDKPEVEKVSVRVSLRRLERSTSRLKTTTNFYDYDRIK